MRARRRIAALACLAASVAAGCGTGSGVQETMPRCVPDERLGIVAQSVPGAAYVPCVEALRPGWSFRTFEVGDGHTRFTLRSDRAERPIAVSLAASCDAGGATEVAPRETGVDTSLRVGAIAPRFTGRLIDEFEGGCVTYEFDFARGPHLGLMEDLEASVRLFPRRVLREALRDRGVDLDR